MIYVNKNKLNTFVCLKRMAENLLGVLILKTKYWRHLHDNIKIDLCIQKIEDHRKKWDDEEYERIATERLKEELEAEMGAGPSKKEKPVKRESLKPRTYEAS